MGSREEQKSLTFKQAYVIIPAKFGSLVAKVQDECLVVPYVTFPLSSIFSEGGSAEWQTEPLNGLMIPKVLDS